VSNFPVARSLSGRFRGVQVDLSRSFGDYIMIDHAVDRSLCSTSVRNVNLGLFYQFAAVNLVGDFSRIVGCVGESYIHEALVCTVIWPQIGELPVHLSIGEV